MTPTLLLAVALSGAAPEERVEQAALLNTFRSLCLTQAAKAGALAVPAAAAGFNSSPVKASHADWKELAAWRRGGIRLFRMTDPRESHPRPMCGVSANFRLPDTDQPLIDSVYALTNIVFGQGHRARGHSNWTLAQRGGRTVSIDIDRAGGANARVTLIAYPRLL